MVPSYAQIQTAAYYRWLRRQGAHGADREDWLAAQDALSFDLNYEVIARYDLEQPTDPVLGNLARRRCRFCEQIAPAAARDEPALILSPMLRNSTLRSVEWCHECREQIRESLDPELAIFVRAFTPCDASTGAFDAPARSSHSVPIAAFKALAAMAVLILPAKLLYDVEDTIEWVINPDHALDSSLMSELRCEVFVGSTPYPHAWAALARRIRDDDPVPSTVFALGIESSVFQIALPLTVADQDLDGIPLQLPRAHPPSPWDRPVDNLTIRSIPLASARKASDTRFAVA